MTGPLSTRVFQVTPSAYCEWCAQHRGKTVPYRSLVASPTETKVQMNATG